MQRNDAQRIALSAANQGCYARTCSFSGDADDELENSKAVRCDDDDSDIENEEDGDGALN